MPDLHLDGFFVLFFSHLSERKMGFTSGESALIGCSLAKRHIRRGALKRAARSGLTIKGKKKKKIEPFQARRINLRRG